MTPTAEWYEADADDSDRNVTDDITASTPQEPCGAILPAPDAAGGYADADVLRGRIAALERMNAAIDRARMERAQAEDAETEATARAEAAEAKLRDVEALRDKWLAVDVPSAEVTSWSHYAG